MSKILVNVFVPSINKNYDVFITTESTIEDVKGVLCSSIEKLTNERFIMGNNVLVDSISGQEYNDKTLVGDTNIENGTKLIIV